MFTILCTNFTCAYMETYFYLYVLLLLLYNVLFVQLHKISAYIIIDKQYKFVMVLDRDKYFTYFVSYGWFVYIFLNHAARLHTAHKSF